MGVFEAELSFRLNHGYYQECWGCWVVLVYFLVPVNVALYLD